MRIAVHDAVERLDRRGLVRRRRDNHSDRIIARVAELIGRSIPEDLAEFYRERIDCIGPFMAIRPIWNGHVGWHGSDLIVTRLLEVKALPLFWDGCGNLFGLDLDCGGQAPAVYFFDHERGFEKPEYAAGSSLGSFLLLLADHDQAIDEKWFVRWELTIDPDIDKCPRARAIWAAD